MNQNNNREVVEISVEDIIPNRFQPILTFDPEALNDLASSIKEHGIIQPLVVRRLQDKFEIIGNRPFYIFEEGNMISYNVNQDRLTEFLKLNSDADLFK